MSRQGIRSIIRLMYIYIYIYFFFSAYILQQYLPEKLYSLVASYWSISIHQKLQGPGQTPKRATRASIYSSAVFTWNINIIFSFSGIYVNFSKVRESLHIGLLLLIWCYELVYLLELYALTKHVKHKEYLPSLIYLFFQNAQYVE